MNLATHRHTHTHTHTHTHICYHSNKPHWKKTKTCFDRFLCCCVLFSSSSSSSSSSSFVFNYFFVSFISSTSRCCCCRSGSRSERTENERKSKGRRVRKREKGERERKKRAFFSKLEEGTTRVHRWPHTDTLTRARAHIGNDERMEERKKKKECHDKNGE